MSSIQTVISWIAANSDVLLEQAIQHLNVAITALILSVFLWVPTGVLLSRKEHLSDAVLGVAGILLTIPSLALLALLIPIVGIGVPAAITALVLYSALPICRNTYVGLINIDESIIEAGRGMGMTDRQMFLRVRVPLALSVIMAGIRQAAVLLVAITTITAFFGAGGLGQSIFEGIRLDNTDQIIGTTIVITVIAIVIDSGLSGIQRVLPGRASGGVR
jgi:osmoprotectant transport system permease protein